MAEVIAATLIEAVFRKLANEALKQVVRAKGIHSELKKLGRTLSRVKALLNDASNEEITNEAVQVWLNDLQHLAYDIDDILDDLATEAMHREFTDQSEGSTSMLQDLEKEKVTLGLTVKNGGLEVRNNRSKDKNRVLETSLVDASSIVGRQGDKDALVQKLLADEPCNKNFSIVPIVGMGGVGKTTLARLLYDEKQVKDHFELKAWVCVSDEWDSFQISKIIFQSVSGEDKKFEDLNLLQVALRDQLREKRFLLVLDDVWSESCEDWETLVRPFHACSCGSKIIMTTRKEQLLKKLGYDNSNRLQRLFQDDAVSLFAQHALGTNNFDSYPTYKAYGEGIVKKCDGLPLALIVLGRLLRTKRDALEWKEIVDSEIWRLKEGDEIIPALRLSYHELPACLKRLFAYCSLFPKDYTFDKQDLVLLWMAEGFLHQVRPSKSTEERLGNECFDELLSRSFFQHSPNDESLFVMHDLMNDLATSVAGDFYFRLEMELGKNVRKQALDKCRHMSFVCEEYVAYKKFEVFEGAKGLRTFLSIGAKQMWRWNYLSNKVLVDLLPELRFLKVLSLSGYEISQVPEFIGKLKHLRYLNLSQTKITHFPENIDHVADGIPNHKLSNNEFHPQWDSNPPTAEWASIVTCGAHLITFPISDVSSNNPFGSTLLDPHNRQGLLMFASKHIHAMPVDEFVEIDHVADGIPNHKLSNNEFHPQWDSNPPTAEWASIVTCGAHLITFPISDVSSNNPFGSTLLDPHNRQGLLMFGPMGVDVGTIRIDIHSALKQVLFLSFGSHQNFPYS
ncbi:NB-ARC domains-containing protein [Artemisia annua]|uniref:NB-ARC domains-containing protein n=1 Tax=Artemisia annua TaxID=35608 RepID=A0A2U1KBN8_ARTAN|nr:NB-ARC domains-containing protein [Artemisia annua]